MFDLKKMKAGGRGGAEEAPGGAEELWPGAVQDAAALEVAQEQELEAEEQELEVAQEQVVECGPNKLGDIFTFVSQGSFSEAVTPLRKKNLKRFARKFIIEDGKLYYVGVKREEKREVVIEPERKRQIFLEAHFNDVGGHLGQKKTVHRIQSRYYWLGIIRDVVDWIKVCETCRGAERNKPSRTTRPQRVDAPWDLVIAEILGPFPASARGHTHVLLLVDYFSKWPEASPLQRPDPESVAREISRCVFRFGAAKTIACSQSPDFCSQVCGELRETWGLVLDVSSVDPLPDCGAPALRQVVLRLLEDRPQLWDHHLDQALSHLRTTENHSTRYSPYSLLYSRTQGPSDCPHLRSIQEQQDLLRQKVLDNMNAAYKQEKKSRRRRARRAKSALADSDWPCCPLSPKKELFLGFPVETVLAAVQSEKTPLPFDLSPSQTKPGLNQVCVGQVCGELRETWGLVQDVSSVDPLPDCGAPALRQVVLRLLEDRPQLWDHHLDQALSHLRTTENHSTRYSPYSLLYSRTQGPSDCPHLRSIQEQQDLLRQKVLDNMNAAYKQEKKSRRRRARRAKSALADPDWPCCPLSPKKELFLGFPVETVLAAVQSEKTPLPFDLSPSQ